MQPMQPGVYGPPKLKPPAVPNVGLAAQAPPPLVAQAAPKPVSAKPPSFAPPSAMPPHPPTPSLAPVANVPTAGVGIEPPRAQRPLTSPQDYLRQRADGERHKQMREIHQALMSMALGRMGKYGGLADDNVSFSNPTLGISGTQSVPGEGLNQAMAAMHAHYGVLAQADTHDHANQLQFGGDIRHDPAYRAAQINHMAAQSLHANAQARALDPNAEFEQMKRVMADPQLRAAYEVKNGVAPGSIAAANPTPGIGVNGQPLPAIHAGNIGMALAQPQNSGLAEITGDPAASFLDKLKRFGQIPDFGNPNSPTRQVFNAHMHQLYPSEKDWQNYRDSHPAFGPDQWETPVPLPGVLKTAIGGPMNALGAWATGQPSPGIGFNWRQDYANGNEESDLLAKYGIKY